jgi:membrane protein required for colicin V production
MNFLDVLLIVPLIYAGYKGFKHGLIIEVFTLMALFVGLYAGINFSDFIAEKLKEVFGWDSPYAPTICFTFIFLGIGAMVYFAGVMIQRMVRVVNLSPIDKFFGVFFALLKMTYILSIILVLIESYDENSTIFLKNAFKEESDSTGLTVDQVLRAKEVADSLGIDANDAITIKKIHDEHVANK